MLVFAALEKKKNKHQNIIIITPASSDPLFRLLGSTGPELNQTIALHCTHSERSTTPALAVELKLKLHPELHQVSTQRQSKESQAPLT